MQKIEFSNITVYLLEDYEVNTNMDMVKDAIQNIRETNEESVYFECMSGLDKLGTDFVKHGYTVDEVNNKNLILTEVSSMEKLLNRIEYAVTHKNVKVVYLNFPDTIVDELPGLPSDYDFICVLMRIMILNTKEYIKVKFNLTVQRSALKSTEILDNFIIE
jgi:hypothetical protein